MTSTFINPSWKHYASISVFLFYLLMLSAPSGYSYGSGLLLLGGLVFVAQDRQWRLSREDKAIVYVLLANFVVSVIVLFWHGNKGNTLDQTSRCLLVIPILLLLLKTPPKLCHVWAGMALGAIAAAGLAYWQNHWLGVPRAGGFVTSAIPFGDMSLMMGILCAAGLFWTGTLTRRAWPWRVVLVLGLLAGVYCAVASETRGAWVAVPAVLPLFAIAFIGRRNAIPVTIGALALLAVLVGGFMLVGGDQLVARYSLAAASLNDYIDKGTVGTDAGLRLEAWRAAIIMIGEKPWMGWSTVDYATRLQQLVAAKQVDPLIATLSNTHNNFLDVWVLQGVFAFLALLALYIVPFWFFCRRLRAPDMTVRVLAVCGASLIASFAMFGMTHVILGRNSGILFFLISLLVFWACMRSREAASPPLRLP